MASHISHGQRRHAFRVAAAARSGQKRHRDAVMPLLKPDTSFPPSLLCAHWQGNDCYTAKALHRLTDRHTLPLPLGNKGGRPRGRLMPVRIRQSGWRCLYTRTPPSTFRAMRCTYDGAGTDGTAGNVSTSLIRSIFSGACRALRPLFLGGPSD